MRGARARSKRDARKTTTLLFLALAGGACCRASTADDTPQLPWEPTALDAAEPSPEEEDEDAVLPLDAAPRPPEERVPWHPVVVSPREHPFQLHALVDGLLATQDATVLELRDDGAHAEARLSEGLPRGASIPRLSSLAGRWPHATFASFDDQTFYTWTGRRWSRATPDDAWLTAATPRTNALVGLRVGDAGHPTLVTRPAIALPPLPEDFLALALAAPPSGDVLALSRDGIATLATGGPRFVMDVLPPEVGHGVALAARARDDLWVAGDHGFGHFDGKTWTVTPTPFVTGDAVAASLLPDGEAFCLEWLMGTSELFHRSAAGAWTRVPIPDVIGGKKPGAGERWFPESVVLRAPGDAWLVAAYRHEASSGGVGSPSAVLHTKPGKTPLELTR